MVASIAATIVGTITAITLLWKAFGNGVRQIMHEPLGDISRQIDNLERVNAARFADLDNQLGRVMAEFRPNGGNSHRDKLEQVHQQVADLARKLEGWQP